MIPRFTAMCAPRWSPSRTFVRHLQGAQLLVLLGLNGLDLRGVAEAFEQLAEPGLAFLRDLLPGREFPGLGRSHQLLGLRVADLQTNHPPTTVGCAQRWQQGRDATIGGARALNVQLRRANGTCAHRACRYAPLAR